MKHSLLGILVATGVAAQARGSKPVDVMVYMKGDNQPPASVDVGARATVTWMYARIGVRLVWRDGELGNTAASGGPVMIQVRFTMQAPIGVSREALARALPFVEGGVSITILYDRVRWVAQRSSREAPILAHVLAHEIGHVLQCADAHALVGVMKAHWTGEDYDSMQRKPLEFTSLDVDLIRDGLNLRKARSADSSREARR